MIDECGTVTRYVYTQGAPEEAGILFAEGVTPVPGLLTQVIKDSGGENQTTSYSQFDAAGNPGTVTGPGCCGGGQMTQYTYDALGRALTKTDALGIVTKYEYDANGNVIRAIADYTADGVTGRNVVTESTYDERDHLLTRRTTADGIVIESAHAYDANGQLASRTEANGQMTFYSYDAADQLVAVAAPLNQTTRYTYTLKGEVETTILPNDTVIRYGYDEFGRKVEEIADESGLNLTTTSTYDLNGNRTTVTDANQKTTSSTYDALNRLKIVEDPLAQTTEYRYDLAGNLRFLTDAEQHTTEFGYTALNQVMQEIRPMGETTAYWYTEAGKLREKRDAKQQATTYTYNDTTGQLLQISYADGKTVTFTYDRAGNLSGYDDGTTSATYTYDALGRKLTETVNYGAFTKEFRYTYYPNGQKQTFTMPGGPTYSYAYHDNNELKHIRIPGVGNIEYPSYTLNRPDRVMFPGGGQQQTFQYDALLRLEQISASGLDYAYTYDNVSNILTKSTEHGTYSYIYDNVSRLINAENPTQTPEAYTYDGVGNRLPSLVASPIVHNENNELLAYGETIYEYDANGNMIRKSAGVVAVNYVYNAENRLVKVEDDLTKTVIAEYYYDPFGRRLWKEVRGTRTYFLYADEGLVAEYDANGNEIRSYGYQPDSTWTTNPLWLKQGGQYYWYQNDHLGTPQKLIDKTGAVVWEARYEAFGKAQIVVNAIENNLRFPGQYYDAETGLHYNWHRYYDPGIGRYLVVDPIGMTGGINLFLYALNTPIRAIDPLGLVPPEGVPPYHLLLDDLLDIEASQSYTIDSSCHTPAMYAPYRPLKIAMAMMLVEQVLKNSHCITDEKMKNCLIARLSTVTIKCTLHCGAWNQECGAAYIGSFLTHTFTLRGCAFSGENDTCPPLAATLLEEMIHTCQVGFPTSKAENYAGSCVESCFGWDPLDEHDSSDCGEMNSLDADICLSGGKGRQ